MYVWHNYTLYIVRTSWLQHIVISLYIVLRHIRVIYSCDSHMWVTCESEEVSEAVVSFKIPVSRLSSLWLASRTSILPPLALVAPQLYCVPLVVSWALMPASCVNWWPRWGERNPWGQDKGTHGPILSGLLWPQDTWLGCEISCLWHAKCHSNYTHATQCPCLSCVTVPRSV